MLGKSRWVFGLFCHYCKMKGIESISLSTAADFVHERFDFDLYNPSIPIQSSIRYPLLTWKKLRNTHRDYSQRLEKRTMDSTFTYHLTKYFSDYLPNQLAASIHTIRSYRDTFVQLMEFYKEACPGAVRALQKSSCCSGKLYDP